MNRLLPLFVVLLSVAVLLPAVALGAGQHEVLDGGGTPGEDSWYIEEKNVVLGSREAVRLDCQKGYVLDVAEWRGEGPEWLNPGGMQVTDFTTGALFMRDPGGSSKMHYTLTIVCLRKKVVATRDRGGARHTHALDQRVATKQVSFTSPEQDVNAVVADCPRGYFPVNGSVEQTSGMGPVRVIRSTPMEGSAPLWLYELFAIDYPTTAKLHTRCLSERTTRSRGHTHALVRKIVRKQVNIPAFDPESESSALVTGNIDCPAGYAGTGLGHYLHPSTYVASFHQTGSPTAARNSAPRKFSFLIVNHSTAHTGKIDLVCLKKKTGPAA